MYNLIKVEHYAADYLKNCESVREGMTLLEAQKIMGDIQVNEENCKSKVWTYQIGDTDRVYYLTYPTKFGASTGTEIYFDPNSLIVTKVVCGE